MSSSGTSDRQPTIIQGGGPTGDSLLLGDVAHVRLVGDVVAGADAPVASAAAALERVEQEIDHLWFDSMKAEDLSMSQRLAEVSHAVPRRRNGRPVDEVRGGTFTWRGAPGRPAPPLTLIRMSRGHQLLIRRPDRRFETE